MNSHEGVAPKKAVSKPANTAVSEELQIAMQAVDIDLVLLCFHDEFRTDPRRAIDLLHDLLLDPFTCEARRIALKKSAVPGRHLQPGGLLAEPRHFVRELIWLANGQLVEAFERGTACPETLGQLASNPDALQLAHRSVMEGMDVLGNVVKTQQAKAWRWLRDEVVAGRLQRLQDDPFSGKHVAVWRQDQPYSEFEIGDDPLKVQAAAAQRWMVPSELVAETFVDSM